MFIQIRAIMHSSLPLQWVHFDDTCYDHFPYFTYFALFYVTRWGRLMPI